MGFQVQQQTHAMPAGSGELPWRPAGFFAVFSTSLFTGNTDVVNLEHALSHAFIACRL
jgi:hypothetical protein